MAKTLFSIDFYLEDIPSDEIFNTVVKKYEKEYSPDWEREILGLTVMADNEAAAKQTADNVKTYLLSLGLKINDILVYAS